MTIKEDYYHPEEITWCPGCGNYAIREALINALVELDLAPQQVVLATGIGQGAKMPHYLNINGYNGLHGRALSIGVGLKAVRKDLTVIVSAGDGDTYGEGGNHFIHNIRRNPDLAHFVHNNQVYGLTKGQASPTTLPGTKTTLQLEGVKNLPFNPLGLALIAGASFVARGFSGEKKLLTELMKKAILHRGYALLDILHPCVSFNKTNTFQWYKQRVKPLDSSHHTADLQAALALATSSGEEIPIGVFYQVASNPFLAEKTAKKRADFLKGVMKASDLSRELQNL